MEIQSLSVVVPNKQCINNCAFCVSKMHCDAYRNQMDDNLPFFDLYLKDYLKRLEFARHNGCNTVMLTGNSEPQQNRKFLTYFGLFMQMMRDPFQWVEMQMTGVMLNANYLRFLRNHVGVNLISLSLSSFNCEENASIIGMPANYEVDIAQLCCDIKKYDFSLRLSINLSDAFELEHSPELSAERIFHVCKMFCADQVTLRVLYSADDGTPQAQWVRTHQASRPLIRALAAYIKSRGRILGVLPYGAVKYSLDGMSVVLDDDCMGKGVSNIDASPRAQNDTYKYLILQPDCKLYSQWDDPASLIF